MNMQIPGAAFGQHSGPAYSLAAIFLLLTTFTFAQAPAPPSSADFLTPLPQDSGTAGLKQELRKLQTTGRLMMVVAHPDDEDGGLLTREARGRGVHTLLLTLTRGEGGQNKTGSTFSDELGILRTLELLAADRYYGVEQRFTRVADFGYSKTADETFQKWGGHDVPLQDIVRVIREFRPDVLIARFSGTDRDGHGHHQASSILTQEAFRAAADPSRFREQIEAGLRPWQAKKLYVGNVCGFGASTCPDENYTVRINTGEQDPVIGTSYFQFAIEGLRHQTSQGLADLTFPSGPRYAFYKLVDSVLPDTKDSAGHEKDIFDGIDVSLAGFADRLHDQEKSAPWIPAELKKIASRDSDDTYSLAELARSLNSLNQRMENSKLSPEAESEIQSFLSDKRPQALRALNLALDVKLKATVLPTKDREAMLPPEAGALSAVSAKQTFAVVASLHNGSKKYSLSIRGASLVSAENWVKRVHAEQITIAPGRDYRASFLVQVPPNPPLTRPYWHREDPERDPVNNVDARYQNLPFPPAALRVAVDYDLVQHDVPHSPASDLPKKEASELPQGTATATVVAQFLDDHARARQRELAVVPTFSVALEPGEQVIPVVDGRKTSVKVGVRSNLTGAPTGTLHLDLPAGWRAEPDSLKVTLPKRGDQQDFEFTVVPANLKEEHLAVRAVLDAGGTKYSEGYTLVTREDLGSFYYYAPARQHISIVDVKIPPDLKVAYIMGAGDDIPTVLQQIGMNVTLIPADATSSADLSPYATIVLGVRAYDTHKELAASNQRLLDFVSRGGVLIVQNNNSVGDFNNTHLTPYSTELSRARVSVEDAPVQVLAPDEPVFHYPNQISPRDFDGWVQERGLYFMDKWDEQFKPLLACHDPGEPDQKGGLLMARYGKGAYIYTGYAFFRQLPAGVPGAIRLFVNLVSAGKSAAVGH
jgi:LmbE family N-acetylglucosaminyl deacetylase